jgi:hypothetical protein
VIVHVTDDRAAAPTIPSHCRRRDPIDRNYRFRSNPQGRDRSTRLEASAFTAFRPDRRLAQGEAGTPTTMARSVRGRRRAHPGGERLALAPVAARRAGVPTGAA